MSIVKAILQKMSSVKKPQRTFLIILLTTLIYIPGKANFRNLSRYSDLHEKTYARGFRRDFNFVQFNKLSLADLVANGHTWVIAIDCSFSPKSGQHTYGLDYFYNSPHGRAEKGLELSTLALVDVDYHTAYHLSSRQTPKLDDPQETRVNGYLKHLHDDHSALPPEIHYVVADGFYSKTKFINGLQDLKFDLVSKLRQDANLRWLYQGLQKQRGRPKKYDGKIQFLRSELTRFEFAGTIDNIQLYTAVVNSVHLNGRSVLCI